jgi:hypothetical protein
MEDKSMFENKDNAAPNAGDVKEKEEEAKKATGDAGAGGGGNDGSGGSGGGNDDGLIDLDHESLKKDLESLSTDTQSEDDVKLENERLRGIVERTRAEYSKRLEELRPLINLNAYLQANPEKARMVAKILMDDGTPTKPTKSSESAGYGDGNDGVNPEVVSRIDNIEKTINKLAALIGQNVEMTRMKESQAATNQMVDSIKSQIKDYQTRYGEYFDSAAWYARMMAKGTDALNAMSDEEWLMESEKEAKAVVAEEKKKISDRINKYIKKKAATNASTAGVGASGPMPGKTNAESPKDFKSAKQAALAYLSKIS